MAGAAKAVSVVVSRSVDPDTARDEVIKELEKPEYNNSGLSVMDALRSLFGRFLEWSTDSVGGDIRMITALLLVAVAIFIAFFVARAPWKQQARTKKKRRDAVVSSLGMSREELVSEAESADRAGDYQESVKWWFRALSRVALPAENTSLNVDGSPRGLTATEIALKAQAVHPAEAAVFAQCAETFNAVMYGHGAADVSDARAVRELYLRVLRAPAKAVAS